MKSKSFLLIVMSYQSKVKVSLWSLFFLFLTIPLFAEDYRIPLEVGSGFHERKDELVGAEIDFEREVDATTFILVEEGKEENIPYYFVPEDKYRGKLYWIVSGTMEVLSSRTYSLSFSRGSWREEPSGAKGIADLVRGNLISNPGFEIDEEGEIKQTATWWKGAPLSEEESYEGKKSLKLVSEVKEGRNIASFILSPIFPLKPNTMYKLSCYIKITEREDTMSRHQSVNAEIRFLNENKQNFHPLHRLLTYYPTTDHPKESYLGKWVKVEKTEKTSENVRYGQVVIYTWFFQGTVYYDNLVLLELAEIEPATIEVGRIEKKRRQKDEKTF